MKPYFLFPVPDSFDHAALEAAAPFARVPTTIRSAVQPAADLRPLRAPSFRP